MSDFFLFANQNPHALVRANGVRFHGYPTRTVDRPDLCVIHTAENTPDYIGEDGGAEAVAWFQASTDRPSSYHVIVDSDSSVQMLPDEAVAFGAKGANTRGIHLSVATRAHLWAGKPNWWRAATIDRLAREAAVRVRLHGIPVRRLTRAEYLAGYSGFVAHADVDPGRRSDPGAAFPWAAFLLLVASYAALPTDTNDELSEAEMDEINKRLDKIAEDVAKCKGALGRIELGFAGKQAWSGDTLNAEIDKLRRSVRRVEIELGVREDDGA